jgi:RimJ/RimL family protein N-acetyltransferase
VTLRPHRIEDADAVVEQCSDPTSIRWTTVPLGYSLADARDFLTSHVPTGWESGSGLAFAVESTHPGGGRRFSGTVALRDEGAGRFELAFGAHPAVRGRGVITAAVNLLLDWGFKDRDVETVIWWANVGNLASRRVAWKTGFTFGGTVRRWLDHRGEYPDAWVASLHRDDGREPKTRWLETPAVQGSTVTLRGLAERDVDRIVQGCSDLRSRRFLPFLPSPYQPGDARAFMVRDAEQASLGRGVSWVVADRASDALLAVVGLPRVGLRDAEIGYWAHPEGRGRGVVTQAVGLVVRHAFIAIEDGGLGLDRVFLKAAASNPASQQVARNNGFTESGRERGSERLGDGTVDDMVVFDLLRDEWAARQT